MPTVLKETFPAPAPLDPPRKRWTRADCQLLESSGLWDRERLELVNGELISKMGKKVPHYFSTHALRRLLDRIFGAERVYTEIPIDVAPQDNATNEPEPDLVVLRTEVIDFQRNAAVQDIELLVEVADSSIRFDLTVKAELYARAEVLEYWVLDVSHRRLIVHRNAANGRYESVVSYGETESITPLRAPLTEPLLIGLMLPPSKV